MFGIKHHVNMKVVFIITVVLLKLEESYFMAASNSLHRTSLKAEKFCVGGNTNH